LRKGITRLASLTSSPDVAAISRLRRPRTTRDGTVAVQRTPVKLDHEAVSWHDQRRRRVRCRSFCLLLVV